jgi:hypothetical protein
MAFSELVDIRGFLDLVDEVFSEGRVEHAG